MRPLAVLLAALSLLSTIPAAAQPQSPSPSSLPVPEVERIIKEYLLREPEVLYLALQELQKRREAQQAEQIKMLLAAKEDVIFRDPADPVLGNPKGDVTLVEFFDYRCGYCRSMMPGLRALLQKDSKLRLVMKELPILGPESLIAARAALAARHQGKYEAMHWALLQAKDLSEKGVLELARSLGLDVDRLARDMNSASVEQVIAQTKLLAEELGINGTPTFVIGETLIPGATPVTRLSELIAEERKTARN